MEISNNELEKLYADTFQGLETGSTKEGKVIAINSDGVIVDVGYKSEGVVPRNEFTPEELSEVNVGDYLEVFVVRLRDSEGMVQLSKERATMLKTWGTIENSLKDDTALEGCITGKTKGGMFVDISGVKAFLPGSHLDIKPTKDLDALIGKKMMFKVLKMNNKRSNLIVSRKAYLEEEMLEKREQTLKILKEDIVMNGIVKNLTDYGVFVDLGGIDGLLHISDISWGRLTHPAEYFAIGDEVQVMVLKYDKESGKVTLGYKQKKPDPWGNVDEKYPQGSKLEGKVVSITDYGAFIEIEEGLEGLVHVSEIEWSARPKHPSKYLSVGETVEAEVLRVDKAGRRLSLSLRQLKTSPWELVSEKYKVGDIITGKVRGITDFGVFVGLPEDVDALIHISDLSWTKHVKHPSDVLKKGQRVEAVVLSIEPDKERMALGLKQFKQDPWIKDIPEKYKLGDEMKCTVLKTTDFGVFVDIDEDVEGLIYSSEGVREDEPLDEGNVVWARIIKIDLENRKIGLSMKNVNAGEE